MDQKNLIEIKKRLLALSLASVMVTTVGCGNTDDKKETSIPNLTSIPSEYSNVEDYYKFVMKDGEAIQVYKTENIYLLFDKETYTPTEYIYYAKDILGGAIHSTEIYDLPSEKMIIYSNVIAGTYNKEYFYYLKENNYEVCLTDVSDYVENHTTKEYYSLDEIRELEPLIVESLKTINSVKVKKK